MLHAVSLNTINAAQLCFEWIDAILIVCLRLTRIAATKSNAETTNCSTKHVLSSKIYWTETIIVALNKAENLLENSSTTCAREKKTK